MNTTTHDARHPCLSAPQTLVALIHERPNVVHRAVSLCRRYRVQIHAVTLARTPQAGLYQMILVVEGVTITPLVAQLRKLIDVLEVTVLEDPTLASTGQQMLGCQPTPAMLTPLPFILHPAQADGAI